MAANPIIPSFNGGELSPRLHGRVDQAVYGIGVKTMLGWLPTIEGAAIAAPGTRYVEQAAGPFRCLPFEYNPTQGYVIEASDSLFRFYTNDVRIEPTPPTPLEVVSPYSYAQLLELDYQQSADVLYLAGGGVQQHKLSRTGAEAFTLAALDLQNGPMGDPNPDETLTLQVSATTGAGITITASATAFAADDVGRLVEIEAKDFNDIPSWEPGITVSVGDKRTWAGKVYRCTGGGARTGQNPPVHDQGTAWDGSGTGTDINAKGPYGVTWLFLYGAFGLARITGFTDAQTVTATVLKTFADSLVATPSSLWSLGAFSSTTGWPDAVCEWNECLVWAMGPVVYVSVVGDLENHERRDSSGDFQRDLAGSFRIPHGGRIKWMAADRLLLIGTDKGEYTVERLQIQGGVAGPPVFDVRLQSSAGSRGGIKPVQTDGRLLPVQAAGQKLLELAYGLAGERYDVTDKTKLARHIGQKGFVELAWQKEPERTLWAAMADGTLAALAYNPSEQVLGWCRRNLAGGLSARSVCCITDPTGSWQQLWIAVETGAGPWWMLRMEKAWQIGDDPVTVDMTDAALSYSGSPVSSGTGAGHLAGKTVQVLADGKPHPDIVVSDSGGWALSYPASKVTLGLEFPAQLVLLKPEAGQSEGTAQGKIARVVGLKLRLLEAQGLRVRADDDLPWEIVETVADGDSFDARVPLFSGDFPLDLIGDYDRNGELTIERFQPTPATLLAVMPTLEVGES